MAMAGLDLERGAAGHRTVAELVAETPGARLVQGDAATVVRGLSHDSRRVRPGDLFVAVPGQRVDGRRFVPDALARGAVAVAAEGPVDAPPEVAVVRVAAARPALADLASAFYGHPSRKLTLVGVTGTDGKTTTTQLICAVLEARGLVTGWLTTVDVKIGTERFANPFDHTTPEAPAVQAALARMVAAGVEVAVLETSSHALALDRVRGCAFRLAVFTNLSPEHLNFHGTMERYRADKAKLFRFPTLEVAVLNADDPASEHFARVTPARVVTYALDQEADFRAEEVQLGPDGAAFTIVRRPGPPLPLVGGTAPGHPGATPVAPGNPPAGAGAPLGPARAAVRTRLLGRFNVANWLAASAAAVALGATLEDVVRAAAEQPPVRGRMELVELGQPFRVVVDFCHTPQALATALDALRPETAGRLLLAFGQAGGRDPGNRPAMGRIAAGKADFFVLTADDPLDEDPAGIARAIARGAEAAGAVEGRDFVIELDRRAAIRLLLARARPGDTVLLAGKGHEQRQLIGGARLPWSDAGVAAELLRELGYG